MSSPFFTRDPFDDHVTAVDTLSAAGIKPPAEWTQVRGNFIDFTYVQSPTLTLLSSAVIDGADEDTLAALRVDALAEATALPVAEATVANAVRATVLTRLRDLYAPVAGENYKTLAQGFTTQAGKLAGSLKVIDPDATPEDVVNADTKIRAAWSEAQQHAAQLTATLPALRAAASLAGITANTDEVLIPLTADVTGLHRRRVWEAWNTTDGRTGRWGALIRVGATVRAADLDNLEPYRRPQPMHVRQEHNGIGVRHIEFDPEDDDAEVSA